MEHINAMCWQNVGFSIKLDDDDIYIHIYESPATGFDTVLYSDMAYTNVDIRMCFSLYKNIRHKSLTFYVNLS
jgi:hypothetical protein